MPIQTPRKIKKQLEELNQQLRAARDARGLTQEAVARKLKWSSSRYSALENGMSTNGRGASLEAYLNAFQVLKINIMIEIIPW